MPWGSKPEESPEVPAAPLFVGGCPDPARHYKTDVNKRSINMERWAARLNAEYRDGYRLAIAFEQDGNTVMVFEHHGH